MALNIHSREKKPTYFDVVLNGRLDAQTSPQLESWLNRLFQSPVRGLNLHMEGIEYISSAGVRAVLMAMNRVQQSGGFFAMTGLQAPVKKVFDIVQILPSQNVFRDEAEADAYFDAMQKKETGH